MMRSFRMRGALAAMPCALVLLAGCAEVEAGSPVAGNTPTPQETTTPTTPPSSTPNTPGENDLRSVNPCTLLTEEELNQFGEFEKPRLRERSRKQSCEVDGKFSNDEVSPSLGFVVRYYKGVYEFRDLGGGLERGQISSGREFVREETLPDLNCTMALAIGENSRFDIMVIGEKQRHPCDVAEEMAELIDPKLPGG